ncbi:MAG: AMP-binding protein [Rhizobiales bacterium]|nr:AMP-binding protein [Hyphomicrobiales bacterium]
MASKQKPSNNDDLNEALRLEQRVLAMVEALAHELNPRRKVNATVHSSLQRDLGFDSLGLSELLLRTEKEFKLRLPDDLFSRLETPLDLVNEIAKSGPAASGLITQRTDLLPSSTVEDIPQAETTLSGVLDWHVRHNPDRPHILLSDGYSETETITYAELSHAAGRLAAAMRSWGLEPGEFVGIMLPTGREFFEIFFGTLLAGAIPVPMYPPVRLSQLEEHLRRQAGILRNSQAALLIIPEEGKALSTLLGGQIETLRGVSTVRDLRESGDNFVSLPCQTDELAMLQYTSGSTGDPKGVMLTHANLLANIRAMGDAIDATSNDIFVSWLPLYHDLGLIGAWFGSLYYAVPVVVMSPLRFIVRPESWLWAIHRNSATLTAAPNFAFEFCVKKIDDSAIEGLDLSSLRMVANGAEPVSADTIRRFTERFEPYGFRPEAMTPVYGLAENAVGLAFSKVGAKPIIDTVSREALPQFEMAVPARADEAHPMSFVSSGVPLPGNEIRIVDALGREVAERQQGRLEFKGPSSTRGYYRNPQKSGTLFHDGWLDSSDLAYVAEGNIFITGRVKDIIIKGGRNIYPEEIEEAVGNIANIRKGCVAAFATADAGTGSERLVVLAETRATDPEARLKMEHEVGLTVVDILGMPADEIILASPHTVPKTSSGKIRRSTTRELYEKGKLGQPGRALWLQVIRLGFMSGMPRLRRLVRTIGDSAYAGWWWLVLIVLAAITWVAVLLLPQRSWRWAFVRSTARLMLRLTNIPLSVSGSQRLALNTGVLAANHSSYFDAVVLAAVLPGEPTFIAKQELSGQYVAGPFLRRLGAQFVERAVAQAGLNEVEAYKDLVRSGQKLVVFPEATFFRMPGLLQFRLGAFAIACGTETLVLPIAISGTRSILRGGQWFPRHGAVKVEVLAPVVPSGHDFTSAIKLRDEVRAGILAHCDEPDMAQTEVVFASGGDE